MSYLLKDSKGNVIKKDDIECKGMDFAGVVKGVDVDKRTLNIIGSDQSVDRDGDIIMVNGWQLENYIKNPVFLWAHDYGSVPLAAAIKISRKRSPWRLELTHKFPTEGINPFADMIFNLYGEKVINAGSVGFYPKKWEKIKQDDNGSENEMQHYNPMKFLEQELLEHSGVAVPSNPNAIQNSIKSMNSPDSVKALVMETLCKGVEFPYEQNQMEIILGEIKEIGKEIAVEEHTAKIHQVPEQIELQEIGKEIKISFASELKELKGELIHIDEIAELDKDLAESLRKILHDNHKFIMFPESKAGAVLNKKNKDRLEQANDLIQEVLNEAEKPEEELLSANQVDENLTTEKAEDNDYLEVILGDEVSKELEEKVDTSKLDSNIEEVIKLSKKLRKEK